MMETYIYTQVEVIVDSPYNILILLTILRNKSSHLIYEDDICISVQNFKEIICKDPSNEYTYLMLLTTANY
jgi:hypothetical protein